MENTNYPNKNCNIIIPLVKIDPLFQSEAKYKAIDIKMIFYSHANKTHFHEKGFAF